MINCFQLSVKSLPRIKKPRLSLELAQLHHVTAACRLAKYRWIPPVRWLAGLRGVSRDPWLAVRTRISLKDRLARNVGFRYTDGFKAAHQRIGLHVEIGSQETFGLHHLFGSQAIRGFHEFNGSQHQAGFHRTVGFA